MSIEPKLARILVKLPPDDPSDGESLWAEVLGDDLYCLRNSPFLAYDLHLRGIVRAVAPDPEAYPLFERVVERSGHRTLRIFFGEETTDGLRQHVLGQLNERGANYEGAWSRLYAVDVPPAGDYVAVCDYLAELEQSGVLHYETGMMHDPF